MTFSSDLALGIGMGAMWIAIVVALVWRPGHSCENLYCPHRTGGPPLRRRDR